MLALTQGSSWPAGAVAALLAVSVVSLALFVRQERRAPDPLMHLELWSAPLIRYANLATLTSGVLMIGVITFLPTYVQGVLGGSALLAGFTLSVMTLGWPIASVFAGKLIVTRGVMRIARTGGAAATAGSLAIALLAPHGALGAGAGSFVLGVGLGLLSTTFLVAIQTSVPWAQRGVATASNVLMRILGQALGAAVFGGVLNYGLSRYASQRGLRGQDAVNSLQSLMGEAGPRAAPLSPGVAAVLRQGLSHSLQIVFWSIAVLAMVTWALAWKVPELRRAE